MFHQGQQAFGRTALVCCACSTTSLLSTAAYLLHSESNRAPSPPPPPSVSASTPSSPPTHFFHSLFHRRRRTFLAPTTAHCLGYRPSNNIPETNFKPQQPQALARTETKRRKQEASVTIDDIESHGFEIQALLGEGSFGHVYGARIIAWEGQILDEQGNPTCVLGDRIAIKRMSKHKLLRPVDVDDYNADSSATMDTRSSSADVAYRREMTALRKVGQHLHLCGLMGTFETASAFYVVLELVEGPPLFDW